MKLDKKQQKELVNTIRVSINKKGYNLKANTIYIKRDNIFIHCDFLIVNSEKIVYRIYIKEYEYDNIFWEIMHMSDNLRKSDSLRACGAFKSPSILLKKGEIALTYEFDEQAERLIELIEKYSREFIEQYEIDEYVINIENGVDKDILKCLAHLHMGKKVDAVMIAQRAIDGGNRGDFENEGKAFFEWVLE